MSRIGRALGLLLALGSSAVAGGVLYDCAQEQDWLPRVKRAAPDGPAAAPGTALLLVTGTPGEEEADRPADPARAAATHAALLNSRTLLLDVVEDADLPGVRETAWYAGLRGSMTEGLDSLGRALDARPVPGTSLVAVRVSFPSAADSVVLANAICQKYAERSRQLSRRELERRIDVLRKERTATETELGAAMVRSGADHRGGAGESPGGAGGCDHDAGRAADTIAAVAATHTGARAPDPLPRAAPSRPWEAALVRQLNDTDRRMIALRQRLDLDEGGVRLLARAAQ